MIVALAAMVVCAPATPAAAQFQNPNQPAVDAGDIPQTQGPSGTVTPDDGGIAPDNDSGTDDRDLDDEGGNAGAGGSGDGDPGGVAGSEGALENGAALPLADAEGGSLPFTGFDLALVVMLGLMLLAAGAAVRLGLRARTSRA